MRHIHGESIGLGSDFDGIDSTIDGLEDVSTFPALVRSPRYVELSYLVGADSGFPSSHRLRSCTRAGGTPTNWAASRAATFYACLRRRRTWRAKWRARASHPRKIYTRSVWTYPGSTRSDASSIERMWKISFLGAFACMIYDTPNGNAVFSLRRVVSSVLAGGW
jgi:hypothetical protein